MASSVSRAIRLGVAIAGFGLLPTRVGLQDLASLITPRVAAAEPMRERFMASPFGTIHAALYTFPQPAGPDALDAPKFRLAGLDFDDAGITGLPSRRALLDARSSAPALMYPQVNRAPKGDRLVPHERPESPPKPQGGAARTPTKGEATSTLASIAPDELPPALSDSPIVAAESDATADAKPTLEVDALDDDETPAIQSAQIYFGVAPMGGMLGALQPWAPDGIAILQQPDEIDTTGEPAGSGETIAHKGEVTGEGRRPKSPAERLGLVGHTRARAEKCLANAVYFEARAEPVRGQIAVAQVVMNRVFSGYYPDNVCGVVYQHAHRRHLACQFTFACDRVPERIEEPDAWRRAEEIAHSTLDGKLWLPDVGKATHYHAYWVHPSWVHEMRKLDRIGVHTFYRPRNWGDGVEAPVWGDAVSTSEAVKKL